MAGARPKFVSDTIYFPRVLPFAFFIAFIAAQPLLETLVDARWLVLSRGLVVGAVLAWLWPRYIELRGSRLTFAATVAAIAVGAVIFVLWISLTGGWANLGEAGRGFIPQRTDGSIDLLLVVGRLIGLVLVVPIMEELFWRSFLLRWIDKRDFLALDPAAAGLMAIAITSALFALEHTQWLAGLLAGMAYARLYVRTRNLWAAILSHATTNALLGVWILGTANWTYW